MCQALHERRFQCLACPLIQGTRLAHECPSLVSDDARGRSHLFTNFLYHGRGPRGASPKCSNEGAARTEPLDSGRTSGPRPGGAKCKKEDLRTAPMRRASSRERRMPSQGHLDCRGVQVLHGVPSEDCPEGISPCHHVPARGRGHLLNGSANPNTAPTCSASPQSRTRRRGATIRDRRGGALLGGVRRGVRPPEEAGVQEVRPVQGEWAPI